MLDKLQKWLEAGKEVLLACEQKAALELAVIREEVIKILDKLKDVEKKAPEAAAKKKKAKSK